MTLIKDLGDVIAKETNTNLCAHHRITVAQAIVKWLTDSLFAEHRDQILIDIDIILLRIEGSRSNGSDAVLVEHDSMLRMISCVHELIAANHNDAH
jgi:hypothetical protein